MDSKQADYRRWILITLAAVVWLTLCLPPLIVNKPEAFQASGSIIVVLAILIYARERARRENVVTQAQRSQIVAMLEEHDKWGSYHESRAIRSSMENEVQLLNVRRSIEHDAKEQAQLRERIVSLQQALDENAKTHADLYAQMQQSHASWIDVHKDAEEVVQVQAPAAKTVERLEIFLIVFGTLQWGYGDRWVEYLHRIF